MNAALEAEGLVKRYGVRTAVRDLSFSVPQGAIYGVLGPNGAGKSTTLRMLVGVLRPSAGRISILGGPVSRDVLKRVGYLPEERGIYRAMNARAAIAYLAGLKGTPAGQAFKRADRLLTEHGLGKVKRKKVKTLSKGMAQKVQVLGAIAHEPDLIIFDEPTRGIDVGAKGEIYQLLRELADNGVAILMISSDMEEVIGVSDRIAVMHEGVVSGTLERAQFSEQAVLRLAVGHHLPEAA